MSSAETIKLLENNVAKNIDNLEFVDDFLDKTSKG